MQGMEENEDESLSHGKSAKKRKMNISSPNTDNNNKNNEHTQASSINQTTIEHAVSRTDTEMYEAAKIKAQQVLVSRICTSI